MGFDSRGAVVVEHPAFGSCRRPLDRLFGAARDEEQHHPPARLRRRHLHRPRGRGAELLDSLGRKLPLVATRQERRQIFFALMQHRHRHRGRVRRYRHPLQTQPRRRFRHRDVRSAERPAATQREIKPQSDVCRPGSGELQVVQKLRGEIGKIAKPFRRIVQLQRIHRLHFEPSDAPLLHRPHLALEFRFHHRRAEPPPPHHDPGIIGRPLELALQIRERRRRRRRP